MQIFFDGKPYEAESGQTVLEAARANGVYIPTLCYHAKTGGVGKCRVCVVEIEGMRGTVTSCTVQAAPDMKVVTNSPALREHQRMIVDLLLSSGHHDCLSCPKCGACELQEVAYFLGIEHPSFPQPERVEKDESAEFIVFDGSKCIRCGRCILGDNCTVVNETLDFAHRGDATRVSFDYELPIGSSSCVQCGECVQLCPTGALSDKKALGLGRSWELDKVNTTCPYCGVGCQVTLHVDRARNRIVRVTGREVSPNQGMLCVKGRYGYDFPSSPKRLTHPMIRKNGKLEQVSWEEALDYTARRIKEIVDRDGPDVFSAFGSGRITNENNYAIQKFTRAVIGTNNVDHCART
jgi:predicted molibdopterin-dependent oxidoreductase YjgC